MEGKLKDVSGQEICLQYITKNAKYIRTRKEKFYRATIYSSNNELAVPNDNLISTNHPNPTSPYSPSFFVSNNKRKRADRVNEQPVLAQNHNEQLFSVLAHELFHENSELFNDSENSQAISKMAQELATYSSSSTLAPPGFFSLNGTQVEEIDNIEEIDVRE
ncbi:hypothetical protein ACQUW5_04495 [Legionella sp. CNM-1927-20]|uniref:hypothetical protein n=1 Tax=Legionella sp. CNM-1927-20 TaxID=3422221 RepID=UPI00403B253C